MAALFYRNSGTDHHNYVVGYKNQAQVDAAFITQGYFDVFSKKLCRNIKKALENTKE